MGALTVLTLVPNAGDRLKRCLESVAWADDLFCVVDPNTTDGSDEVASSTDVQLEALVALLTTALEAEIG